MHNAQRLVCSFCALSFVTLAAVGCGDQADNLLQRTSLLPAPVALDGKLVFVDAANHRAFVLDARGRQPSATAVHVELPFAPSHAERRNGVDVDEALVLCDGRRSSRETAAEPAALAVVEANGKLRSYPLGTTPFDRIVQSDDGHYALLFRNSSEPGGRVLNNANELAIVDLELAPGKPGAVTPKTLTSFGHTPTGAVFSPTLRIGEEDRRLLVVLSQAEVTLIDLTHLDRRETIVQLGGADNRSVAPQQVLFSSAGDPTLYVRGGSSDDIFVFRLEPRDAKADQNDFRPSINQLGGGVGPTDMALFGDPQSPDLLVVAQASSQAIVVDPSSSKAIALQLPAAMKQVLLFTATSPKDNEMHTRALLYSETQTSVIFFDLEDIEARGNRNLEVLDLGKAISRAIPLLSENKLLLLHQDNGVSLLDLAQRTVVPITSNVALSDALFDGENKRLWVAPKGDERIGTLQIDTGVTDELLLDARIELLIPLFDIKKLAVVHPSDLGYVTFLDVDDPTRESARSVRGFLVADVLDRGAQ